MKSIAAILLLFTFLQFASAASPAVQGFYSLEGTWTGSSYQWSDPPTPTHDNITFVFNGDGTGWLNVPGDAPPNRTLTREIPGTGPAVFQGYADKYAFLMSVDANNPLVAQGWLSDNDDPPGYYYYNATRVL